MRHPLDWTYLKDLDLYAEEHGDTNQVYIWVMEAHHEDGEYAVTYVGTDPDDEKCVIFTKEKDGTYRFIANVPAWCAKDPTNGGDVDQTTITDGMLIPDSDSRKLTEDDLKGFDKEELRIARNEIYARHGRKFSDKKLQEHFNKMEWYFGTIDPGDFDDSSLSKIELYNLDLISEYEKKAVD